ncbi:hypothetical protein [Mycolicibacterium vinylchloridicum]|uniref:hypothetical protein n=1 Tax=Mycolicibacterium vinylchloridicum TaxID=2736928 RepID=UPI0015CD731E|nr:hypothetical protein [Mycolicibacterium vinylchloridicum]
MSALHWVITYLSIAALVTGGAMVFAAWSHKTQQSVRAAAIPALLAGAVWPLVLAGFAQWLLVYAIARTLRKQPERNSAVVYYGSPKVNAT